MLGLASTYPKQVLIGPKPGLFLVMLFCCQFSFGATVDSPAASIKSPAASIESPIANIKSFEATLSSIYIRAERIEVNYSAGFLLLPEWELLSMKAEQMVLNKSFSSSGDIALTVAEINLLDSKEKTVDNLELILADCPAGNLACAESNAFPLTALAWLFAPGILGLIGVQRRVWESGGV